MVLDGPGGLRIDLTNDDGTQMSDEERAQMRAELDDAVWFLRPMFQMMLEDERGFANACSPSCRACSSSCSRYLPPSCRCSIAAGLSRRH